MGRRPIPSALPVFNVYRTLTMSKCNCKRPERGYFKVPRDVVKSQQFNSLSNSAQLTLLNIMYCDFHKDKAIRICFKCLPIRMSRGAWFNGIKELQKKLFIAIIPGAGKAPSTYVLNQQWRFI